jgi:hypothetical protein
MVIPPLDKVSMLKSELALSSALTSDAAEIRNNRSMTAATLAFKKLPFMISPYDKWSV